MARKGVGTNVAACLGTAIPQCQHFPSPTTTTRGSPVNALELPNLNLAVAPARDKPPHRRRRRPARARQRARRNGRRPAHGVNADAVRREDLVAPRVILELKDGYVAIAGGAGEQAARVMRGPRDQVHACGVESEFVDFLPKEKSEQARGSRVE